MLNVMENKPRIKFLLNHKLKGNTMKCPKCGRPVNEGNSPNKYECTETDDENGVCEAYAEIAILKKKNAALKKKNSILRAKVECVKSLIQKPKNTQEAKEMACTSPLVNFVFQGRECNASKLVWWLSNMAGVASKYKKPVVNDWVVETTHVIGCCRAEVGLLIGIGKIIKIDRNGMGSEVVTLLTIEGKEQTWENANFACLDFTL